MGEQVKDMIDLMYYNRYMTKRTILLFLAVLVLIIPVYGMQSCDYITGEKPGSETTITAGLDGTQWKLISIDNINLLNDSYIYFQFSDNSSFWSYAGVNFIGGKYVITGNNTLSFTDMDSTAMASYNQALMDQEKGFWQALGTVSTYRLNGNKLEMNDTAGANVLIFEQLPEYAMNPANLNNTEWRLSQIEEITVPADVSVKLSFLGDGKARCYAGKYITDITYFASGDNLRITGMSVVYDDINKLQELAKSERRHIEYSSKIDRVVCYRFQTDRLEFYTLMGDTLVFLRE
jgi:heat shock protein HslJ